MRVIQTIEQLPLRPPKKLIGRGDLLKQVNSVLSPQQSVLLYGMDGIGKHAIAATVATTYLRIGREVLWLDAMYPLEQQIEMAYQKPHQTALAEHTPLLIIDHATNHESISQFIWQTVKAHSPAIVLHTIATDTPWEPIAIRPLNPAQSTQLFSTYANHVPDYQLLDLLGGHPFSIQLAARSGLPMQQWLSALPDDALHPREKIQHVIQVAFNALDNISQGLLMIMATTFSHGMSDALLTTILGTASQSMTATLRQKGFITEQATYYHISPVIQRFAHEKLTHSNRLTDSKNRLLKAIVSYAANHMEQRAALLMEITNIKAAAQYCAEQDDQDSLKRLYDSLKYDAGFWRSYGVDIQTWHIDLAPHDTQPTSALILEPDATAIHDHDIDDPLRTTIKAADDTQPRKPQELVTALTIAGETALTTPIQTLQLTLQNATNRQDRPVMARLSSQLGDLYLEQHDPETALRYFTQAVDLYQTLGDLSNLVTGLYTLATHTFNNRGGEAAQDYVRRGMNIARQLGDDAARSQYLSILGDIRIALGDTENGMEAYKRAIRLLRLLQNPQDTGIVLSKLATVYLDIGRYREAVVALSQAIELFDDCEREDLAGRSLGNLGTALGHLGRWREAGQKHAAALKIARDLQDLDEECFQLQNLAYVSEVEGYMNWAINYNQQALYIALLLNDQLNVASICFELGRLLMDIPETLGQAVILLEYATSVNPTPDSRELTQEANYRYRRAQQDRMLMNPIETDLLQYAKDAYRRYNR